MASPEGRIFHLETMGAVDGPGLRLVLFLQGCPLRCSYCHNPEGWAVQGGRPIEVEEVVSLLSRNRAYYSGGGLTVSGGEPLLQSSFLLALFRRCREEGFHTALDTSGCLISEEALSASIACDLLLLDIKHADPVVNEACYGFPLEHALEHLRAREKAKQPTWVRQVVMPEMTDSTDYLSRLSSLLAPYSCVEKIELLPFRKLCLEKYAQMGLPYPLCDMPDVSEETIVSLRNML